MTNWRLSEDRPASSDNARDVDLKAWMHDHPDKRAAAFRLFEAVIGRKAQGDTAGAGQEESRTTSDTSDAA